MCERSREGMKTLRNSAENTPPFFITPLFLILREPERLGCLKWNSLRINNRSVISLLEQRSKINHETNLTTQIKHPFETVICSFFVDYNWSIDQWKGPYFGGMFSGLLDQSFTQSSPVFIRISSSLSFSASASSSSSDCKSIKHNDLQCETLKNTHGFVQTTVTQPQHPSTKHNNPPLSQVVWGSSAGVSSLPGFPLCWTCPHQRWSDPRPGRGPGWAACADWCDT